MKINQLATVLFAVIAGGAQADTFSWIGPDGTGKSGGAANVAANWQRTSGSTRTIPSNSADIANIDPGEGVEITITEGGIGRTLNIKSGTVNFTGTSGTSMYLYGDPIVNVSEGAVMNVLSGHFFCYNNNSSKPFTKKGAGELHVHVSFGSNTRRLEPTTVNDGKLVIYDSCTATTNFTVAAGATLEFGPGATMSAAARFDVAEGGTLKFNGSGSHLMDSISGAGEVAAPDGAALMFTLKTGPGSFTGEFTGSPVIAFTNHFHLAAEDFRFPVSDPRYFENFEVADSGAIEWAAGIGSVYVKKFVADPKGKWYSLPNFRDAADNDVRINAWYESIEVPAGGRLSPANTVFASGEIENGSDIVTERKLYTGVKLRDPAFTGTLAVENADAYVYGVAGDIPKRIEVTNGRSLVMIGGQVGWTVPAAATAENPAELVVDGGRVEISNGARSDVSGGNVRNMFAAGANAKIYIGANGAEFHSYENKRNGTGKDNVGYEANKNPTVARLIYNHPFEKDPAAATAGAVSFLGWTQHEYRKPFGANLGEIRFMDGCNFIADLDELETADGRMFGTGDVRIRSAVLGIMTNKAATTALKLPGTVTIEGGAGIVGCYSEYDVPKAYEIGTLVRENGAVLTITDVNQTIGSVDGVSVKVTNGVAVDSAGVSKIPAFQDCNSSAFMYPLKYDAEKGFVSMEDSDWAAGYVESAYCKMPNTAQYWDTPRSVLGLQLYGKKVSLTTKGAVLTIGDQENGGIGYVISRGGETLFDGAGKIDFGVCEGVFRISGSTGGNGYDLGCEIAGQNGVTYSGPVRLDPNCRWVHVRKANSYVGGTYISAARVSAYNPLSFGFGDVKVFGGEMAGGQVFFACDGEFLNNFSIGGFGIRQEAYNAEPFGAMVFVSNAVVRGTVELTEPTRISVKGGITGTFASTVSGAGSLILYNDRNCPGTLALGAANTYSGGTEIVGDATIAVSDSASLGTGRVRIDGGTLAFRDAAEITLANDISGKCKLRYDGAGKVALTGDISGLEIEATELTQGTYRLSPGQIHLPLVSVESEPRRRPVLVLGEPTTYRFDASDLSGTFEIVLEPGARLELVNTSAEHPAGLYRFTGNREDVIGYFTEDCPKTGAMLILR